MRVVLDTNVLISAFLWQKNLRSIYQAIRSKKITPCFTQTTWQEFLRALSYPKLKKQLSEIDITPDEIITLLASQSYFVSSFMQFNEIAEDPSDNHILECALSSGASFIISGDKHLLKLKEFHGISILSPKQFLQKHLKRK